ncbi:polysaccharide biosynthesis tyrosine autokinase [Derxia gummosa]|uniref:Polysaccharide biosynthesis tyrosine autokinase n=1 Tax=Derxia gummosa DSM 723 TaxID=1121388 RepID=A0A8B6X2E8_9BURK|nr:polysaccharide biosynthesis tyrosine autokinase [Derxia gummosa]
MDFFTTVAETPAPTDLPEEVRGAPIGEILRRIRPLSDEQIQQILQHQRDHGTRFGEAAVALDLATGDEVLWALSQQFHYPYLPKARWAAGSELVTASDPFSDVAESFRDLRSRLMMNATPDDARRAIAVVSHDPGDGKTFFAANLAIAYSQLGARTLLIDADMRHPRLHSVFDLGDHSIGLSNALLTGRLDTDAVHQAEELPSLFVLPVGTEPPNPLELVQRPAFGLLLSKLLARFDHVIVDTPAASYGADARVIAAKCGAALAIARKGHTRVPQLQSFLALLGKSPARMLGVVMNEH